MTLLFENIFILTYKFTELTICEFSLRRQIDTEDAVELELPGMDMTENEIVRVGVRQKETG